MPIAHLVVKCVAVNVVRNQFFRGGYFDRQNCLQKVNHFPGMRLRRIIEINSLCKNVPI